MNEGSKNYSQADLVDHRGVAGVVKNDKGEILMQKHVKYGFWTIPVGKVDPGESIDDALKKELKEECGISVTKFKEIANKKYKYVRSGENVVVDSHIFEIQKYTGDVINSEPEKHSQQLFMPISKVKKLKYLSDNTLLYLETLGLTRKPII